MTFTRRLAVAALALAATHGISAGATCAGEAEPVPGVVSHIQVVSDKVEDVSSLEAWKRSFLKEGTGDQEKALAIWKSVVAFEYDTTPPLEFLEDENCVRDPIKAFNVYGYGICSDIAGHVTALARFSGLQARGWAILGHSIPEIQYDGGWHMWDAAWINYWPKADGKAAGVEEMVAEIKAWLEKNPDCRGNDAKLRQFAKNSGWKKGPDVLSRCPVLTDDGVYPEGYHGWFSAMQNYDEGKKKPNFYEYGSCPGYQLNIQLRPGERLTRNWSHKGLHVNMDGAGGAPDLKLKVGEGPLAYSPKYGDLALGRIGNGTIEYDVPLASGAFRAGALTAENLACKADDNAGPALHVKDPAIPGVLTIRMPSSYVCLGGEIACKVVTGEAGETLVEFSDNNGLDWRELARFAASGDQKIDLKKHVFRRYDYRLRFTLKGKGTGLDALKIAHDIQHSQRALPALDKGENRIAFSAGPAEGTVTILGSMNPEGCKGKQLSFLDFHPTLQGLGDKHLRVGDAGKGEATVDIATPGEMTRVRMGVHYRARDARDGYEVQVSFDGGNSFKAVDRLAGPVAGTSKYVVISEVPAGTKAGKVRLVGTQRNTAMVFGLRIDADYREPNGGLAPVKITYVWTEGGQEKKDVRVAKAPGETYAIQCGTKPTMKSIVLELAE